MSYSRFLVQSPTINVMTSAVQKAARGLIRDFNEVEHLQVSQKSLGDFVSTADFRSEKVIMQELKKARPGYGFITEESGLIEGENPEYRWILDPLDGTSNFLHGIPHFCVSLALEKGDEVIAGVIHDPIKDEIFWAEKGKGAFLNQRRLRVTSRKKLEECLIATGIPHAQHGKPQLFMDQIQRLMPFVAGFRRMGSAALDMAYVAAGRNDAYFEQDLKVWDLAAGVILVQEAGGIVTDLSGGHTMLETGNVLASSMDLHNLVQKIIS